jgi:hypothetical protein
MCSSRQMTVSNSPEAMRSHISWARSSEYGSASLACWIAVDFH